MRIKIKDTIEGALLFAAWVSCPIVLGYLLTKYPDAILTQLAVMIIGLYVFSEFLLWIKRKD